MILSNMGYVDVGKTLVQLGTKGVTCGCQFGWQLVNTTCDQGLDTWLLEFLTHVHWIIQLWYLGL